MATILILYREESTRDGLATELRCLGHEVIKVSTPARAVEVLQSERVDVMIAEMGSSLRGLDPVSFAAEVSPRTRAILTSEDATASDYKRAVERGAADVLNVPLVPGELERAVQRALERSDGFHGNLHGLDLTDILQVFHQARRTLVVRVGVDGEIHMLEGEVIHASAPPLLGRFALKQLLGRRSGAVDTRSAVICPRTVDEAFQPLLLDLMRELDEERVGTGPRDLRLGPPRGRDDAAGAAGQGANAAGGLGEADGFDEIIELEPEDLTTAEDAVSASALSIASGPEAPLSLPESSFSPLLVRSTARKGARRKRRPTPTPTVTVARRARALVDSPVFWGLVAGVLVMAGGLFYVSLERGPRVELTRLPPRQQRPTVESLAPLASPAPVAPVAAPAPEPVARPALRVVRRRPSTRNVAQPSKPRQRASEPMRKVAFRASPERQPAKHAARVTAAPEPRRPAIGLLE